MADQQDAPWVCPWGICNHEQAQKCRATFGNTKLTRGCGNIFPPGTTLEQAKEMIGRPRSASGVSLVDGESSCDQTPIPSPMDSEREG